MNNGATLAMVCDLDGRILELINCHPALADALQIGGSFTRIIAPGNLAKALSFLVEVRTKGTAFDWEINIEYEGWVKTLHFTGGKMGERLFIAAGENGKITLGMFEDMMRMNNEQTDALRMALKEARNDDALYDEISCLNNELVGIQRELAKKNAELERLNAEKNRFLGMAAHDLRNPLHAILSYSAFLLDDRMAFSPEERREFMGEIFSATQFMARLVDDLLDVAKIESGQLTLDYDTIDLNRLVQQNVDRNQIVAAKKQIEIQLQAEPLPPALVDGAKLEQILNNLLSNAVKFSQPGSRISVRLKQNGNQFELAVADQGSGMSAEELAHLFKPFQRGRKGTAGEKSTGLGMVIVKRIVDGHGGSIDVASEPGRGTTFTVLIPFEPPQNQE